MIYMSFNHPFFFPSTHLGEKPETKKVFHIDVFFTLSLLSLFPFFFSFLFLSTASCCCCFLLYLTAWNVVSYGVFCTLVVRIQASDPFFSFSFTTLLSSLISVLTSCSIPCTRHVWYLCIYVLAVFQCRSWCLFRRGRFSLGAKVSFLR